MFQDIFKVTREFVVLNAGDQPAVMGYDAEEVRIPACNEIVYPKENAQYKSTADFHSAKDSEGKWIPGSLIIRDIYDQRGCPDDIYDNGGIRGPMWDGAKFLVERLGIDPITKKADEQKSKFTARGLTFIPQNPPTPELVKQIREAGEAKWNRFEVDWARERVEAEHFAATAAKAHGVAPRVPDESYYRALSIAQKSEAIHKAEMKKRGLINPQQDEFDEDALKKLKSLAKMALDDEDLDDSDERVLALVDKLLEDRKFKKALSIRGDFKPGWRTKKKVEEEVQETPVQE